MLEVASCIVKTESVEMKEYERLTIHKDNFIAAVRDSVPTEVPRREIGSRKIDYGNPRESIWELIQVALIRKPTIAHLVAAPLQTALGPPSEAITSVSIITKSNPADVKTPILSSPRLFPSEAVLDNRDRGG